MRRQARLTPTRLWFASGLVVILAMGSYDAFRHRPFSGSQADCMDDVEAAARSVLRVKSDSVRLTRALRDVYRDATEAGFDSVMVNRLGDYVVRVANTNGRALYVTSNRIPWLICSGRFATTGK